MPDIHHRKGFNRPETQYHIDNDYNPKITIIGEEYLDEFELTCSKCNNIIEYIHHHVIPHLDNSENEGTWNFESFISINSKVYKARLLFAASNNIQPDLKYIISKNSKGKYHIMFEYNKIKDEFINGNYTSDMILLSPIFKLKIN